MRVLLMLPAKSIDQRGLEYAEHTQSFSLHNGRGPSQWRLFYRHWDRLEQRQKLGGGSGKIACVGWIPWLGSWIDPRGGALDNLTCGLLSLGQTYVAGLVLYEQLVCGPGIEIRVRGLNHSLTCRSHAYFSVFKTPEMCYHVRKAIKPFLGRLLHPQRPPRPVLSDGSCLQLV